MWKEEREGRKTQRDRPDQLIKDEADKKKTIKLHRQMIDREASHYRRSREVENKVESLKNLSYPVYNIDRNHRFNLIVNKIN